MQHASGVRQSRTATGRLRPRPTSSAEPIARPRAVAVLARDRTADPSGALTLDDDLAVAAGLVIVAHDADLTAGQKNAVEFARELRDGAGFDFAVAE